MKNLFYRISVMIIIAIFTSSFTLQDTNVCDNTTLEEIDEVPVHTLYTFEFVDMGLPSGIKWATCNLGAKTPGESGFHYAWGETETKREFSLSNYYPMTKSEAIKNNIDSRDILYEELDKDISGNLCYDAVCNVPTEDGFIGKDCQMPTLKDWQELLKFCKWENTMQEGQTGYIVIGLNRNSIFLPTAGYHEDIATIGEGSVGFYWTSTPSSKTPNPDYAQCVYFDINTSSLSCEDRPRWLGYSIRPVKNP